MPAQIIKVSQLNRYVRAQLEENTLLGDLLVKGELTSVSWRSSSGHFYFTISEGGASLHCVMFARYAEDFLPFRRRAVPLLYGGQLPCMNGTGNINFLLMISKTWDREAAALTIPLFGKSCWLRDSFLQSANAKHLSFRGPLALLPLQKAPLCRISSPGCSDIMI